MNKILIQPRVFHVAMDYGNMELFDKLLNEVDETQMANKDKLAIIRRFHYRYSHPKLTLKRYIATINRLNADINKTCYSQTLLTHLVNYDYDVNEKNESFVDYLLSRPDINVNKPDRYTGFPVLQSMFCNLWGDDKVKVKWIKKLLKAGAKWNICHKKNGRNVLQAMVREESYSKSFEAHLNYLLYSTDIDMSHKDKNGKTVLDLAEERIVEEQKSYDDMVKNSNRYYSTPTKDNIDMAFKVANLIKIRTEGGI